MSTRSAGGIEKYVSARMKRLILTGRTPRWIAEHRRSGYIVSAILSAPLWVSSTDFKHLRRRADDLTRMLGKRYVLDHIEPLQHPLVCGLTVPWNIQVISYEQNMMKGNKRDGDQLRLFSDVEQFELLL